MKRFMFFVPALVLVLFSHAARATRVLEHYDLDSLVYLSNVIVRAEVGDSEPFKTADGDCLVHTVKVLGVFKGSVKAGASFRVTGLDVYHYAPGMDRHADSWGPIQKGDTVYLFLVPNGTRGYSMYGLTNADWTVLESGARLQNGESIFAFGQYFSRSATRMSAAARGDGFVVMTGVTFPGAPVETRNGFEERITQSQQTVTRIDPLLAGDATARTDEEIIRLLRARPVVLKSEMATSDALGSELAQRLSAAVAAAELLSLLADSPNDTRFQLEDILQSRVGRSYLLQRVADRRETTNRRQECAGILSGAGWNYTQDVEMLERGEIKALDTDFATRLARLAVDNLGTKLCAPLLAGVADCVHVPTLSNARLAADLQAAAKILSEAYSRAAPLDQFYIAETLMQMGPQTYRQFLPDACPLLTLVEPDRDFDDALKRRTLHLKCRFRNHLSIETDLKLVLRPANGKPDIEVAADTQVGKQINSFGNDWRVTAAIPDGIDGKYRVFLRNYRGNHPDGDGLGFQIEIPQNERKLKVIQ